MEANTRRARSSLTLFVSISLRSHVKVVTWEGKHTPMTHPVWCRSLAVAPLYVLSFRYLQVGANYTPETGIYKSQAKDVDLGEYENMSLTDFVFQNFCEFSDHIAVVDSTCEYSYHAVALYDPLGVFLFRSNAVRGRPVPCPICRIFCRYPSLFFSQVLARNTSVVLDSSAAHVLRKARSTCHTYIR